MRVERCWSGCSGLALCGLLVFLLGMSVQPAQAGCGERESPNCCSGRNNECFEYTKRKTVCYCDTYCQKTGDCCEDYKSVCQISAAIDCVVGSWGAWSACSSLCGGGSTERSRQVLTPPRYGGTPCPDLKQRRGCLGHARHCKAREVAKILPDSFKRNFKDPWRRPHMLMKEEAQAMVFAGLSANADCFLCCKLKFERNVTKTCHASTSYKLDGLANAHLPVLLQRFFSLAKQQQHRPAA
ncbi:thrombospondin type-1 domain-containing protein 7A [Sardina pilchardus]|uniref:thrombospondin type-1 domain-containing protein 7A n=1 Tax=Sardina pilchardus TaxID=27697 RepID=UPI002E0F9309